MAGRINFLNPKTTCLLLIGIWAYALWETIQSASQIYLHSGFDYQGFVVLPTIALLVMSNSSLLKRTTATYSPLGLFYLLFFAIIWLIASITELELLRQIASISMLIAIILTSCGKKVTSILLLPFFCLFLLLPVGQQLYATMQHAFAWALMHALMITEQAVYWESGKIIANNHVYDIQAYLSGMQHLLVFLTLGAGYAMLRTRTFATTIYIASSFVIMPLITLWLALFCYATLHSLTTTGNGVENHIRFIGWSLTLIGLGQATMIGVFLADRKNIIGKTVDIAWRDNVYASNQKLFKPAIMATCILLVIPFICQNLKTRISANDTILPSIPTSIAAWKRPADTQKTLATTFKKEQKIVNLAISHNDQILDKSWKKIKESNKKIKLTRKKMPVHETVFHNSKNKYRINWTINYVNGHFTTNPVYARALARMYNLATREVKGGILTLSTDATAELSVAREHLKDFLQDLTISDAITS